MDDILPQRGAIELLSVSGTKHGSVLLPFGLPVDNVLPQRWATELLQVSGTSKHGSSHLQQSMMKSRAHRGLDEGEGCKRGKQQTQGC